MNWFSKKLAAVCAACLLLVFAGAGLKTWVEYQEEADRLTPEQIEQLRGKYPMGDYPAMMDILFRPVEDAVDWWDTFVYGEVLPKRPNMSTAYEYPVRVIRDTRGYFEEGEVILIWAPYIYRDGYPKPETGSRIVCPIGMRSEKLEDGRVSVGLNGFYYVTQEDYTIPAFPDDNYTTSYLTHYGTTAGLKVDVLLKRLRR